MARRNLGIIWRFVALLFVAALPAAAQSFRVQCPTSTVTHPVAANNNSEPAYTASTQFNPPALGVPSGTSGDFMTPVPASVNGAIKCQQVSGGDGYSTMANGIQTFMFSFGPLSGLADIAAGLPGTEFPNVFNQPYDQAVLGGVLVPGDPATTDGASDNGSSYSAGALGAFSWNGAVGIVPDPSALPLDVSGNNPCVPASGFPAANSGCYTGHVDPRQIMDIGVMNGNIPAPLVAFDEDDEMFLTLTNVGMIMRPDLFEQHTIHFHGYPNASSVYDGVPDASVAINIGGSFTYYYMAPDAGTYFWHCHITPPEHLQMGMVGQLYVRPRQDRVPTSTTLYASLAAQQADPRTACRRSGDGILPAVTTAPDILCANPLPIANTGETGGYSNGQMSKLFVYNDGDGSTEVNDEYALQIHGFDPNFHFVGMTFNPEAFVDMKSKFFLLNGRSYPDTVQPGPMATQSSDTRVHYSQPLPSIINIPAGGKVALRIADLAVDEYATLATMGIPMKMIGFNAKLLRDQSGNNLEYYTHSITLGGGESLDVMLDASDAGCGSTGCSAALYPVGSVFYLYTPQLDHLSNDQENFGGLMTEVHICNSVDPGTHVCH